MTSSANGTLLVPVANTQTADRLIDTAIDIALDRSYRLIISHVVEVPDQLPLSGGRELVSIEDEQVLEHASELVEDAGVETETRTRLARTVSGGIVSGAEEHDADIILMGWRGRPPRRDIILGGYLDTVLRDAPCDVITKRIKSSSRDVESVLVPVASGPHNEFATNIAGSIARQHDVPIHLLHVLPSGPSDAETDDMERLLRDRQTVLENGLDVTRELVKNDHVAGAITDATTDHDVTVLGVTEKGVLQRKILGTVSEAVGRHADGTVILAQKHL